MLTRRSVKNMTAVEVDAIRWALLKIPHELSIEAGTLLNVCENDAVDRQTAQAKAEGWRHTVGMGIDWSDDHD